MLKLLRLFRATAYPHQTGKDQAADNVAQCNQQEVTKEAMRPGESSGINTKLGGFGDI